MDWPEKRFSINNIIVQLNCRIRMHYATVESDTIAHMIVARADPMTPRMRTANPEHNHQRIFEQVHD